MTQQPIAQAYGDRADEYAELFGSIDSAHPSDVQLVETWQESVTGVVVDAGCGPGHWTEHLYLRGADLRGIDLEPQFVEIACRRCPSLDVQVGNLLELPYEPSSIGGILAWYSLVHLDLAELTEALDEFSRVLVPGGGLLLGYFTGERFDSFDHAVTTAFQWPQNVLSRLLEKRGFSIVETHQRSGQGYRPHGAIVATRR